MRREIKRARELLILSLALVMVTDILSKFNKKITLLIGISLGKQTTLKRLYTVIQSVLRVKFVIFFEIYDIFDFFL